MGADEMFKRLRYKKIIHKPYYSFYYKTIDDKKEENEMNSYHIEFDFANKKITKTYGDDNTVADITMEELEAIYKKCKELRWLK